MRFLLSLTLILFCFGLVQAQVPAVPTMVSATCAGIAYNGTSCSPIMDPHLVTTETRFELFRKITSGGSYIQVQELPAELKNTSVDIRMADYYPGISPGDVIYYKVRACNASGCSADSGEVSATAQASGQDYVGEGGALDVVPATPTSVTGANNSSTMNTITYSHADSGAWDAGADRFMTNTLFKVYRKESSQSSIFYREIGQDYNGSFEDREIDLSKTYKYAVRACRRVGCSVFGESSNVSTPASYSAPVAALTASSTTVIPGETFYVSASGSTNVSDKPWGTYNQNPSYSISFGTSPADETVEVREWGYAYRTAGTKIVTVTVYNPAGTSDTETLNITVLPEADAITTDAAHTCSTTASDTSACTTARHRPPAGSANAFHNALRSGETQTKPLIELAKGQANEYIGRFAMLDRTGAGATTWMTIQPLDYAANFIAEVRVTGADRVLTPTMSANLAWIKHNHDDNTLGAIGSGQYGSFTGGSDPKAEHVRIRGIGFRKSNEATVLSAGMIVMSMAFGDNGDPTPGADTLPISKNPSHFIFQHIYSDTSANTTNYLKSVMWIESSYTSVLDSHLYGAKKLGEESYGIFVTGNPGPLHFDNNLIYGSTMAIFYDGSGGTFGPEYMRAHSSTRRSHLTRLLTDQAAVHADVNHKNMWETKGCKFCGITSSVVDNWWNEDQQHMFTITNTNQVGYNPFHTNNFILIKNVVARTAVNAGSGTGYVQLYNRDNLVFCGWECAGYSEKTSHVYLLNNLFFASAGITAPEYFINKGTFLGEPSSYIIGRHNTVLTNSGNSVIINNGEQLGNVVFNGNTTLADNVFRGTISGTTFGSQGVTAMTEYERAFTFRANAVYGALSADANYTPWAADEYYFPSPDSITGISFTDATNFDYRLSGSSAFRAGQSTDATDDIDVGVNVTTIKTAVGGSSFLFGSGTTKAESGDWTAQGVTIPSNIKGRFDVKGRATVRP